MNMDKSIEISFIVKRSPPSWTKLKISVINIKKNKLLSKDLLIIFVQGKEENKMDENDNGKIGWWETTFQMG